MENMTNKSFTCKSLIFKHLPPKQWLQLWKAVYTTCIPKIYARSLIKSHHYWREARRLKNAKKLKCQPLLWKLSGYTTKIVILLPGTYSNVLGHTFVMMNKQKSSLHNVKQVWPLTQLFSVSFLWKLIDLPEGQINDPSSGKHYSLPFLPATPSDSREFK